MKNEAEYVVWLVRATSVYPPSQPFSYSTKVAEILVVPETPLIEQEYVPALPEIEGMIERVLTQNGVMLS